MGKIYKVRSDVGFAVLPGVGKRFAGSEVKPEEVPGGEVLLNRLVPKVLEIAIEEAAAPVTAPLPIGLKELSPSLQAEIEAEQVAAQAALDEKLKEAAQALSEPVVYERKFPGNPDVSGPTEEDLVRFKERVVAGTLSEETLSAVINAAADEEAEGKEGAASKMLAFIQEHQAALASEVPAEVPVEVPVEDSNVPAEPVALVEDAAPAVEPVKSGNLKKGAGFKPKGAK